MRRRGIPSASPTTIPMLVLEWLDEWLCVASAGAIDVTVVSTLLTVDTEPSLRVVTDSFVIVESCPGVLEL